MMREMFGYKLTQADRTLKLTKYKRARVREYWMIDPDYKRVYVYDLETCESYKI